MDSQKKQLPKRIDFIRHLKRAGPEHANRVLVDLLFESLGTDFYPGEEYEQVFGVEMERGFTPLDVRELWIGKLTYCAWQTLYKNFYITKDSVIDALWNQKLPEFFEKQVRQLNDDFNKGKHNPKGYSMNMTTYVPELLKRGFNSIPWDLELHQLLSKEIKEIPCQLVSGIRVEGDQIITEQIQMDSSFEKCTIAVAAGIPLFVKKLNVPGKELEGNRRYIICRMMSEPSVGVASPRWGYGGSLGPAPPVLVARSDAISFTEEDWYVLDDFEMQMLDDGPREVTREDFVDFANGQSSTANVILEVKFPKGQRVRIVGLQRNIALNDKTGEIAGRYENGRVGIKVDGQEGVVAVKPDNINISKMKKKKFNKSKKGRKHR